MVSVESVLSELDGSANNICKLHEIANFDMKFI